MREGWIISNIEDVCSSVFAGGDVPKDRLSKTKTSAYNIPIFANGETDNGLYGFTDKARVEELSITISARGTIGFSVLRTEPYLPVVRLIVLIPNHEIIDISFLHYVVKSMSFVNSGTSIPQLTVPMVKKYDVHFPKSISEQKQIVSILDKAFAAIDQAKANIERNIENAKELFQSKLNEIFSQKGEGWEEKTLSEVCRYDKTKHNGEDLPYVGLEHIESNTGSYLGDLEPMKVKSSTFAFNSKHVLYGRLRPYLNKVLLPDFSGHCSTEIFPIITNEFLKRRFLFYWFLAPITVHKIDATWTGARMPRANMNEVINFKINIPSIEIQTKLSKELDSLMQYSTQIENKYKSKLIILEELKKSILQKAFAGELTEKTNNLEKLDIAAEPVSQYQTKN